MNAAKDLRREALSLSRAERAGLARELLESLDDSADPEAEQAWLDEAEQRSASLEAGAVQHEAWATVRDRIAQRLRAIRP